MAAMPRGSTFRTPFRVVGALAMALGAQGAAMAGDLISHNGFAECWSQAITRPLFLEAARAGIDGLGGCVSTQSGNSPAPYSICDTNACAGGLPGCSVTLHASDAPSGDFGTGHFSGAGSADGTQVHLTVFGVGCTMTLTGITLTYAWDNVLQADGNGGRYVAELSGDSITFDTYTVGGDCQGSVNSLFGAFAATQARTALAAAIKPQLEAATLTESVCPLAD